MKAIYCILINLLIINLYPPIHADSSESKTTKSKKIEENTPEENSIDLDCVHEQIIKFAKRPENAKELWVLYTSYQMRFVAYSEHGPSIMAFSELHEALHNEVGINNFNTQHPLLKKYKDKLNVFINTLEKAKVNSFTGESSYDHYDNFLNKAYSTFLISLVQENHTFFEKRFINHLNSQRQPDIIDRAFFSLQPNWPSYEKFSMENKNSRHQLETLYILKANNGKIFIASYNERPHTCDSHLRLFKVDTTKSPINVHLSMPQIDDSSGIDITQSPRLGGCNGRTPLNKAISFDGNQLKVRGYDYRTLREFLFDTNTEKWSKLTEKELSEEQIQSIYREEDKQAEEKGPPKCKAYHNNLIWPTWR